MQTISDPGKNSSSCNGFTMLEIVITLTVLSILGGIAVVNYNKLAATTELEKDVLTIYKELSSMKTLVMKFDKQVKAEFSGDKLIINKFTKTDTINLKTTVAFSVASSGPSKTPFNQTISTGSGGCGLWKDSMIVHKDALCSIDTGYVLVSSSKVKTTTYYIGVNGNYQGIRLYKWVGGSWIKQ